MAKYKIAWLPGDGVGNDVMECARLVLDNLGLDAEYIHGDIGWEFWKSEGDALPERTVNMMKDTDCALFGAITSKPKEEAETELNPELQGKDLVYFSPIVRMRQAFNLHTNLRPCKAYPGNPLNLKEGIDITIFRENTEGMYSGEGQVLKDEGERAEAVSVITKEGAEKILHFAYETAIKRGRKKVTAVHKANILKTTSGLFLKLAREIAKEYPQIESNDLIVDNTCMQLVMNPHKFDVIVTTNLFGDIISDLCAGLVGGLGLAPGGNIGKDAAIFEAVHGSAPDIAGQNIANPCSIILAAAMMLEYLGMDDKAGRIRNAIRLTLTDEDRLTPDLGGTHGTTDFTEALLERL